MLPLATTKTGRTIADFGMRICRKAAFPENPQSGICNPEFCHGQLVVYLVRNFLFKKKLLRVSHTKKQPDSIKLLLELLDTLGPKLTLFSLQYFAPSHCKRSKFARLARISIGYKKPSAA